MRDVDAVDMFGQGAHEFVEELRRAVRRVVYRLPVFLPCKAEVGRGVHDVHFDALLLACVDGARDDGGRVPVRGGREQREPTIRRDMVEPVGVRNEALS